MSTPADQLDAEIERILKMAKLKADDELKDIKKTIAKETAEVAKEHAPSRHANGYKSTLTYKAKGDGYVVYSKGKGQLTHLLEFGHAIAGGTGKTRAFPHFSIALEHALKRTEEELEKIEL
ncbi:Prophage pi2 protein 37 [gut metagenome]|uniref:Prophage pi2 protein 37 n=1 Tax=gut metagenome TaxID=749906 RepID=J9GGY6_9ZZZZ